MTKLKFIDLLRKRNEMIKNTVETTIMKRMILNFKKLMIITETEVILSLMKRVRMKQD